MTVTKLQPKGWKKTTLGEVAVFNYGEGLKTENRVHGRVPVYGSSGITGFHDKALINEPGYIVGRKGTVGSIYYSPTPFFPIDTVYYLTKRDIKCDFKFFYYLLNTLGLDKLNFDSVVPGLNREMAYSLSINIPEDRIEQHAIAVVPASFDNKIELLREQNKTLETTAQAIFKEWFVTPFGNLPKNKLPKRWKMGALSEIADFLNGLALQKYPPESNSDYLPVIKIKELKSGISDQTDKANGKIDEKYIVQDGDILFSWSGSLEVAIWKYGKGALNQHLFKVTSKKYPKWFCFFWIKEHLPHFRQIAASKSVTMGHIQRHHLDDVSVVIPDDVFLKKADETMSPLLGKIILNNSQIQTLLKLRDTLLPKIMKGEIRIKEFER